MPRVVDSEERRQELTDAAARLIARAGIGAATMRGVASEAGWTTGALTHYFTDKRELLLSTFKASLESRHRQRAARDQAGPEAVLRATLTAALPLDEDSRRHWMVTVAFCAEAAGDAEMANAQRDAYRDFRASVAVLVEQAAPVRGPAALAAAERLIVVTNGIALQALFDPVSWPPRRQLAALEEALEVGPAAVLTPRRPTSEGFDGTTLIAG